MSRWEKTRREARKPRNQSTEPKKRILVVCEGQTEVAYINWYKSRCKNNLVEVTLPKIHEKTTPRELVNYAKESKSRNQQKAIFSENRFVNYDEVWCVFDRDEHPYFEQSIHTAKASNIKLAISIPCFELWVYLHIQESPGMQHHQKMLKMVKKIKPDYKKGHDYDFESNFTMNEIELALNR
ncbi:MAG: hypothetical protein RJA81_2182, partial [Planctomycetota bacterium]